MKENMQQPTGASEREELLRELVLRLATFPGDQRTKDPQRLIGEVPPTLDDVLTSVRRDRQGKIA